MGEERRSYWLRQWAKALRSGKYTQGHGPYYADGCFCATGVLLDLMIMDGLLCEWELSEWHLKHDMLRYYPGDVRDFNTIVAAEIVGVDTWTNVVRRNDHQFQSFSQIADFIDGEGRGVFAFALHETREAALARLP